jgi:hypothetical protein
MVLALTNLVYNYRYADISRDWSARERGEQIFSAVEPNAVFLGTWIDVPILEYLQIVENHRQDVRLVNVLFTSDEQERRLVGESLSADLPVYTSINQGLSQRAWVSASSV